MPVSQVSEELSQVTYDLQATLHRASLRDFGAKLPELGAALAAAVPELPGVIKTMGRNVGHFLDELPDLAFALVALARLAEAESKEVRMVAAWAMGEMGVEQPDNVTAIAYRLAKDDEAEVRDQVPAVYDEIIGPMQQRATIELMRRWANDSDEKVRRVVPLALVRRSRRDPQPVLVLLEESRHDSSLYVRRAVVNSLQQGWGKPDVLGVNAATGPTQLVRLLKDWARDSSPFTRWVVAYTLAHTWIERMPNGLPEALAILRYIGRDGTELVQKALRAALTGLRKLDEQQITRAMYDWARDSDPTLSGFARQWLTDFPADEPEPLATPAPRMEESLPAPSQPLQAQSQPQQPQNQIGQMGQRRQPGQPGQRNQQGQQRPFNQLNGNGNGQRQQGQPGMRQPGQQGGLRNQPGQQGGLRNQQNNQQNNQQRPPQRDGRQPGQPGQPSRQPEGMNLPNNDSSQSAASRREMRLEQRRQRDEQRAQPEQQTNQPQNRANQSNQPQQPEAINPLLSNAVLHAANPGFEQGQQLQQPRRDPNRQPRRDQQREPISPAVSDAVLASTNPAMPPPTASPAPNKQPRPDGSDLSEAPRTAVLSAANPHYVEEAAPATPKRALRPAPIAGEPGGLVATQPSSTPAETEKPKRTRRPAANPVAAEAAPPASEPAEKPKRTRRPASASSDMPSEAAESAAEKLKRARHPVTDPNSSEDAG